MSQHIREVIGRQMRVTHRHLDIPVTQDALQGEDVPALHHVVAGERVPQDVGQLPRGMKPRPLIGLTKSSPARAEEPPGTRIAPLQNQLLKLGRNRHRPPLPVLGPHETHLTIPHLSTSEAFGLIPACPRGKAELGDRERVTVRRCLALLQQQPALIQGEIGPLGLFDAELSDGADGVWLMPHAKADQFVEDGLEVAVFMVDRCRRAGLQALGPIAAEIQGGEVLCNGVAQGQGNCLGARITEWVLESGAVQLVPRIYEVGEAHCCICWAIEQSPMQRVSSQKGSKRSATTKMRR